MARFDPDRAAELVRRAREDAGLTQAELAQRAGLRQPSVAQIERGTRKASGAMLGRILSAADYRPSLPLEAHAADLRKLAAAHGLSNLRVFGSTARGEDGFDSDIDLLVTPATDVDLFDVAAFVVEAERLTGFPVDVVTDTGDESRVAAIEREAVPL